MANELIELPVAKSDCGCGCDGACGCDGGRERKPPTR